MGRPIIITPEIDARLRVLACLGFSLDQAACDTGVKKGTIISWSTRTGISLSRRRVPDTKDALLRNFHREGVLFSHAAQEVGMSHSALRDWEKKTGLTFIRSLETRKNPTTQTKPRTCLRCGETFASEGPGNRICPKHNLDAMDGLGKEWLYA